jgi:hypothetical protein
MQGDQSTAAGMGLGLFVFLPRPLWQLSDILTDPWHAALWMPFPGS